MSAEHRDGIQAQTVNTHHSGIFVLILDIRRYRPHTDTHRPNEHKRIEILPALAYVHTTYNLCFILLSKHLTQNESGDVLTLLTDLYNRYLLHFNIVIG